MKDLNSVVAGNLKRIREEMKLSLEKVSEITGVSKAMLRQIETGESSPTINTVWKIATGLKVSYTSIINLPQPDTVVVTKAESEPMIEDDGKYQVYSIFPSEDGRRFEIYAVEIEPKGSYQSNAHGERIQEFITVFDGELTVQVDDKKYTLKKGDSIRFRADRPHSYHNGSDVLTRISLVIYYPI